MCKLVAILGLMLFTPSAFSQTNPFGSIAGDYKVVSCKDLSVVAGSAYNFCESKTVFIGVLPGDSTIGARFVDIDYVVFNAKCGDPVICTERQIHSERQNPKYEGQKLITDFLFTPQQDGTLLIHFRRQLVPKMNAPRDLDAAVDVVVQRR